jgi:hypothetical protein
VCPTKPWLVQLAGTGDKDVRDTLSSSFVLVCTAFLFECKPRVAVEVSGRVHATLLAKAFKPVHAWTFESRIRGVIRTERVEVVHSASNMPITQVTLESIDVNVLWKLAGTSTATMSDL